MDKIAALTAFAQVVDKGGFAAAGRALGLSRSQVSKLVMALEDELDAQLLIRTTRHVSPTPTGRAFYDRAVSILDDLRAAEDSVRDETDEPQGLLRVNAPMTFGTMHLAPAIADLMTRHPPLRIQLSLNDRHVDPVAEGYDVTVRIGPPSADSSLIDHPIGEARRVLCASPDYLKNRERPDSPQALAAHSCLHYGHETEGAVWRLTKGDAVHDIRINCRMASNNGEALRAAAVAGLGVALLPTFIVGAELQTGRLVTVLDEYAPPELQLCLLYPPNRHFSPRMRAFVEFCYERFGDRPYWDLVR